MLDPTEKEMKVDRLTAAVIYLSTVGASLSGYQSIFNTLLPSRLQGKDVLGVQSAVKSATGQYLYAGEFETVEELVFELFGDVEELKRWDPNEQVTFTDYYYQDGRTMPVEAMGEQLVAEVWLELWRVYKKCKRIFEILEKLSEKDYEAVYDCVYPGGEDEEVYENIGDLNWDIKSFQLDALSFGDNDTDRIQLSNVPLVDDLDLAVLYSSDLGTFEFEVPVDWGYNLPSIESDDTVNTQLIKLLLKIPFIIVKVIVLVIWNLIELKKLVELAEAKAVLWIIKILMKICHIIMFIKDQIVFELKVIVWTFKTKKPLIKAIQVLFLIIKKLNQLLWIVKDLLYRYKWKIYWILKRAKKKSIFVALYLEKVVYAKLDLPTKEEKQFPKFFDPKDEYVDGDYFKEFAHYQYIKPGNYRDFSDMIRRSFLVEEDLEMDEIWEQVKEDERDHSKDGIIFDYKEEFGFNSVRLDLKNIDKQYKKPVLTKDLKD